MKKRTILPSMVHVAVMVMTGFSVGASKVTFTASPSTIQVPITQLLTLRCGLTDGPATSSPTTSSSSTTSGGLVGRSAPLQHKHLEDDNDDTDFVKKTAENSVPERHEVVLTEMSYESEVQSRSERSPTNVVEDIRHISGIWILKDGHHIAAVTPYTSASTETGVYLGDDVTVTGDVAAGGTSKSGELGFLQIQWGFPTANVSGQYQCSVAGVTEGGHVETLTEAVEVEGEDMISELSDLKKLVSEQQMQINTHETQSKAHEARISSQEALNKAQDSKIQSQQSEIDALKSETTSQKSQINSLTQELSRVSHTESGVIDCGRSSTWKDGRYNTPWFYSDHFSITKSVRVTFTKPFQKPPIIQLSVFAFYNDKEYEKYAAIVEKVDAQGFTARCMTHQSDSPVYDMDISWIGIPA